MAKPITVEMLQAMSLEQRKTLQKNAISLGTPAAKAVLELLSQDDLLGRPKPIVVPRAKRATTSATKPTKAKTARAAPAAKSIKAVHGRQA